MARWPQGHQRRACRDHPGWLLEVLSNQHPRRMVIQRICVDRTRLTAPLALFHAIAAKCGNGGSCFRRNQSVSNCYMNEKGCIQRLKEQDKNERKVTKKSLLPNFSLGIPLQPMYSQIAFTNG
jgi:hypothetical protein